MAALLPTSLRRAPDLVRLPAGSAMTLRLIEPADIDPLRRYFDGLSQTSRYNRFLGASAGLSRTELDRLVHSDAGWRFGVLAEIDAGDARIIIAEALYARDRDEPAAVEFGLSVADRWLRQGVGSALLANLEGRAAALGASRIFGETFAANQKMLSLARKQGYRFTRPPSDWRLVRFEKDMPPMQNMPRHPPGQAVPLAAAGGRLHC